VYKGRRNFTKEEVDNLLNGVRQFGFSNWATILKSFDFQNRNSVDLKDKFRNLRLNHQIPKDILAILP